MFFFFLFFLLTSDTCLLLNKLILISSIRLLSRYHGFGLSRWVSTPAMFPTISRVSQQSPTPLTRSESGFLVTPVSRFLSTHFSTMPPATPGKASPNPAGDAAVDLPNALELAGAARVWQACLACRRKKASSFQSSP